MADIKIAGTLRSGAADGKIAVASEVFDELKGRYQSEINDDATKAKVVADKAAADIGVDSTTLLQGGIDSDGSENTSSYYLRTSRFSTFKLEVNNGYTIGQIAQYDLIGNFVALYNGYTQIEGVEWTPTSVVATDKEYMWVAVVFKGNSPTTTISPREAVVKSFASGLYYYMEGSESDPQSAAAQAKMVVDRTIEQLPNEEDLTLVDGKMQLANRAAAVVDGKVSNLGYVILRPDRSFAEQVTEENCIYEIRYEFDLNGEEEVKIPANCTLKFNGGKLNGNGILNLNKGKVEGDGLNCNIINPFDNTINSSQVGIVDEESHNADRLEFLVQKGIKVIFNTNATFSRAIQSRRYKIDSLGSHTLSFPSSSGLTFVDNTKSVYSANNEIKNVNIISQGNCIDFCDEEGNRPANIYWSKFSNLNLKSENGYCFYAGDNKGGTGDQLVFNCDFEDIKVSAGISGFYGLNGIQIVFKEVKDEYCVVATFEDCAGKFDCFNGTFAFEEKTTPTFLKANANKVQRLYSEFNKCNFEDYSSVLFDCNQPETYCHFSFTNCQIYISKSADTIIDKSPFQFHYLYNLVWNNNRVLHFGQYATGVALMNIVNHIDTSYTGDTKIPIIGNGYSVDLASVPYKRKSAILIPAEYGKKYLPSTDGMVINEVHTELIHTKIKKVNIVSNKVDLWGASAIGLTVTNDVEGEVYLDYFDQVYPYSRIHRSILLYNNNSNATIVIHHKLAYAYRFECEDEADIKLKPKECVEAILDIEANAAKGKCIIKSRNKIYVDSKGLLKYRRYGDNAADVTFGDLNKKDGTTEERPTETYIGFQYFDTTLSKPIWWDGSKWVDSTGIEV